jgi:hypothetical protein
MAEHVQRPLAVGVANDRPENHAQNEKSNAAA